MKESVAVKHEKKLKIHFTFSFLKKDPILSISLSLAILSCLIHTPEWRFIHFNVLISLFNLMLAVKAFEKLKLLDKIAVMILSKCQTSKRISAILILLCFFSSMFITNDVALLTFVPLTLMIGKKAEINLIETIILQTIAANIGSSLTPMGNPQNLFIYSYYGLKPQAFFLTILLLGGIGILLLFLLILQLKNSTLQIALPAISVENRSKTVIWGIIFCLIIASILGFISYVLAFFTTLLAVFLLDRELIGKIDYGLLLTFICFFIFVGNLSSIGIVRTVAGEALKSPDSVYFSSILLSQFISNVPASILLAKFSLNWQPLLLGVDIGGLGTIIASLASLISYKLFITKKPLESKRYFIKFSLYNFSFLAFLTIVQYFILKMMHSI